MPERMMQFFAYENMSVDWQAQLKPFHDLASIMVETLPSNPERTAGLRKLVEARDCAVRAALFREQG